METTETSLLEKRGSSGTGKGSYLELYRDVTLLSAAPQALSKRTSARAQGSAPGHPTVAFLVMSCVSIAIVSPARVSDAFEFLQCWPAEENVWRNLPHEAKNGHSCIGHCGRPPAVSGVKVRQAGGEILSYDRTSRSNFAMVCVVVGAIESEFCKTWVGRRNATARTYQERCSATPGTRSDKCWER